MADDFAHRLELNRIRDGERIELVADEAERRRTAERLGLGSIERFEAHATLERNGPVVRARGRLRATLEQNCVVSGEPVAAHADEPFDLMFVPELEPTGGEEEIELGEGDCDLVFHDGSAIDLGGAIADTLALGLDPYPRTAGADAALREAGVMSEDQAGPFAALAQLKKTLGGGEA
jgi:uncharacterized metal-binding protein YceD (DUF177 family)